MDPDLQLDPLNPPKYCPQCSRSGVKSKVKKFKMDPSSPDNVTIMCKNDQCPWPFSVQSPADVTLRSTAFSNTTSTPFVKDRKRKKKVKSDDQGDQDTSQEDILFSSKKSKYESSTLTTITNSEVAINNEVSNQIISPPEENPVDDRFKVSLTKMKNCVTNKDQDQVEHLFITDDLDQKLSLQPLGLLDKICTTKLQSCKENSEAAGMVKDDYQPVDEEAFHKDVSTLDSKFDHFSSSNDVQTEEIGTFSVVEPSRTSFLPDYDSMCPTEMKICDTDGDHGTFKDDTQVATEESSMADESELISQNNLIEPVFPICESFNKSGENFALENVKSADMKHTTHSLEKKESMNEEILLNSEARKIKAATISVVVLQKTFSSKPLVLGTKNSDQQIQIPDPVLINHVQDMNKKNVTPLSLSLLVESPLAAFAASTCLASITQLDSIRFKKEYKEKNLARGNEEVRTRSGRKVKSSKLQTGDWKTGKVQEIQNKLSDISKNSIAKFPIKACMDFKKCEEKMRIERLIKPPYPRRRSKSERKPVSVLVEENPPSSQLQLKDLNPHTKLYKAPSETYVVSKVIESILETTVERAPDIEDEVVCFIKPKHTFQRVSKKREFVPSLTMETARINHNASEISLLPPNTYCFNTKHEEFLESTLKTTDEREAEVVCVIKPKRTFQRVPKKRNFLPSITTKPVTNMDAINLEPERINHNASKISMLPPNTDCFNTKNEESMILYKLGIRCMSLVEVDTGFPFELEPNNNPVGHHRLEDSRKQNVKPTMEENEGTVTESQEAWFRWRDWKVDQEFLQDFSEYIRNIISKWNLGKKTKIDPRIQALLKEKEENKKNQQQVLKKIDFFAEVFVKYLYIKTHCQTLSLEKVMGMLKQNFILENQQFVANISQIKEQLSTTNNSQDNSTHSFGQESSQVATQVSNTPQKAHLSAPLRPPCPEQPVDLSATANPSEVIIEENLYEDMDKRDNQMDLSINSDHVEMPEGSMDLFDNVEKVDLPTVSIDLSTNIENIDLPEENMELSTNIRNVYLPVKRKGLPTNIENRDMPKESRDQSTKHRDLIEQSMDQSTNVDRVEDANLLSLLDVRKTTQLCTFHPERKAENDIRRKIDLPIIKSNINLESFKNEETSLEIQAKGMKSLEKYRSVCKANDVPEKFRKQFARKKSELQKDEAFNSTAKKNITNTNGKEINPFLTSSKALRKDQLNVTGIILVDAKTTSGVLDKKMNSSRRKSSTPSQVASQKPNQEKLKLQLDEALSLLSNKHHDVKKPNTKDKVIMQKAQITCTATGGDTDASFKLGSFDQAFTRKKQAEKIQKVLEKQKMKAQEGKVKKYRGFGEKLDPKAELPMKKVKKEKRKVVVIKRAEVSNSERDLINELLNIGEFAVADSKSTSDEQEVEPFEHSKDTSVDDSTVFDAFDFDEFQLGDSLPTDKDLAEDLKSLFGF